jgi:hypothetical protein
LGFKGKQQKELLFLGLFSGKGSSKVLDEMGIDDNEEFA